MLWWWFKQTLKFPLYSPHTLLYSIEKNCWMVNNYWFSLICLICLICTDTEFQKLNCICVEITLSSKIETSALEKGWNIKLRSSDTARWSLWNICWGSRWFNYELSLIRSIERTCKMSFLINTCIILISGFMSTNWFFALYLLLKILFVYQYSNPL